MYLTVLLEAYGDLVKRRPAATQICTAGLLGTIADIISQRIIERKTSYDFRRTIIMAICAFLYFGPIVTIWYTILSRYKFDAITNVLLDQFVVGPVLLLGFILLQTILRGQGLREIRRRLISEYPKILTMNWLVWIPAQFTNFKFVPLQYRMLFSQVIALFWNCYICWKTSDRSKEIASSFNT